MRKLKENNIVIIIAVIIGSILLTVLFYKYANWLKPQVFFAVVLSFLITNLLGFSVPAILKEVTSDIDRSPPRGIDENEWKRSAGLAGEKAGNILGTLERMLFLATLWFKAYMLIGVWLAFKLGTKWQAWQQIIKPPEEIDGRINKLDLLRARRNRGTWYAQRFLIGTIANIICAIAGFAAGKLLL
jgi:hypothetical protein